MPLAPTVPLPHGVTMPQLGLGTWPMSSAEAERAVPTAIEAGYRLVDTAYAYGNEEGVGSGLRGGGIPREELFVTTKLNAEWHGVREFRRGLRRQHSQARCRVPRPLSHPLAQSRPGPLRRRLARALPPARRGLVRAIGVSNFKPAHLERLLEATGVAPDVNQIELNPYLARTEPRAFHAQHGIVTQSYSPIDRGGELLREPVVVAAAERLNRTPAQVVLRWHVQQGLTLAVKSSDPARQAENLAVFDFELSEDEMAALSALDRGEAAATDSDTFGH